ncbi:hypothetical protein HGM15179_015302 [Zosterops borbonicus]|uniref:Uncharacterized protein n=1 Tax=Zosterops borbonicus TaxID=364589 RepID=A0A8K1LFH8_9PASS|nr:hypothetical protein HGM15179_015302 [Zosterops borbonicus]
MGQDNPQYRHRLEDKQIENSPAEKDLGLLVCERLDMTQPCEFGAQKARGLRLHPKQWGQQSKGRNSSICSALVRRHLEPCIQLWGTQYKNTCWSESRGGHQVD